MRLASIIALTFVVACGSSPVGKIRFHRTAPVWRVDDRQPLPAVPESREHYRLLDKFDTAFAKRAIRAMELRTVKPALDINSLDEVPDSTWFTNRIGIRDLSLDELRQGPIASDSPFEHRPWTITGTKVGGRSLGFTFVDATKRKFLLKFDLAEFPELETGTHIVVNRILWSLGYNVPEDHIGYIERRDLVVGDKAVKKGFDETKLDDALKRVYRRDDGKIRVLASLYVAGTPIGPYAREGVRADDLNDLIPHERRRTLRGQYPIFAWLDHTDMKESQTVDSFDNGYVTHYLVDFGKALGGMGTTAHDPRGHAMGAGDGPHVGRAVELHDYPRLARELAGADAEDPIELGRNARSVGLCRGPDGDAEDNQEKERQCAQVTSAGGNHGTLALATALPIGHGQST